MQKHNAKQQDVTKSVIRTIGICGNIAPLSEMHVQQQTISYCMLAELQLVVAVSKAVPLCGLTVWFDQMELTLGDSLRRKIYDGLANSRFGVVILSHDFFSKEWPQRELDGLVALEDGEEKKILPVWHKVTQEELKAYSPLLADDLAYCHRMVLKSSLMRYGGR